MIVREDPGCPAVVGYARPHEFELGPLCYVFVGPGIDDKEPIRPWECRWRLLWGTGGVAGYTYQCVHRYRCSHCHLEIPLPPRLCPWWIDRPSQRS